MVMSGASMGAPPQQKMTSLFNQIDTAGAGSITMSQFQTAFNSLNPPAVFKNAGFDSIYNHLDPAGSGSVSKADFVNGMKGLMASLRAPPKA
jgi:Ca2+-binding EF-hand superfamily protein